MPGQGLLQVPCGVTSVQSLADWVDSWVGPFPIGDLSLSFKVGDTSFKYCKLLGEV